MSPFLLRLPSHFLPRTHVLLEEVIFPQLVCACVWVPEKEPPLSTRRAGQRAGWWVDLWEASHLKTWRTWKTKRSSTLCRLVSFTEAELGWEDFPWCNLSHPVSNTWRTLSAVCVCVCTGVIHGFLSAAWRHSPLEHQYSYNTCFYTLLACIIWCHVSHIRSCKSSNSRRAKEVKPPGSVFVIQ